MHNRIQNWLIIVLLSALMFVSGIAVANQHSGPAPLPTKMVSYELVRS